jgi:hypothetical protein
MDRAPFVDASQLHTLNAVVLGPSVSGCQAEGLDFQGIFYPGVMLGESGPRSLRSTPVGVAQRPRSTCRSSTPTSSNWSMHLYQGPWRSRPRVGRPLRGLRGTGLRRLSRPLPNRVPDLWDRPGRQARERQVLPRQNAPVQRANSHRRRPRPCVTAWAADLASAQSAAYQAAALIGYTDKHRRTDIPYKGLTAPAPAVPVTSAPRSAI